MCACRGVLIRLPASPQVIGGVWTAAAVTDARRPFWQWVRSDQVRRAVILAWMTIILLLRWRSRLEANRALDGTHATACLAELTRAL